MASYATHLIYRYGGLGLLHAYIRISYITHVSFTHILHLYFYTCDTITKLPEYGVLCDNITEFGVAEDHLSL